MTSLTAILTHENPDLDSTLCVWLLRRFGEARYPGIRDLPVRYVPAGMMPDDLHPDELERTRGLLAVDTGGGRLDTHARDGVFDESKRGKSAALLVAEDLEVAQDPALQKLLQFVTQAETRGRSISSAQPMDHLVSLPNLVRGLNIIHRHAPERVMETVFELYDAAYATELEWFQAVEDFKQAQTVVLADQSRLVAIHSDTGAALKVARMHKADLIVHRNTQGHTGITARNNGALSKLDLAVLAEVVRIAEAMVQRESLELERVRALGVVHGWYLHDSGRILSKGSPKNRELPPSRLAIDVLLALAAARLDASRPMPPEFCAVSRSPEGTCAGCPFYPLQMQSCAALRVRAGLEATGTTSAAASSPQGGG